MRKTKIPRQSYPPLNVNFIRDEDLKFRDIRRLSLELGVLADQLDVPADLFRKYRQARLIHELKHGEKNAGLGFSAEELTAFAIVAHCHHLHSMDLSGAANLIREITVRLANTFEPFRVFFCLKVRGDRKEGAIFSGRKVRLSLKEGEVVETFDLTDFFEATYEAMGVSPLKLSNVSDVQIPETDDRIIIERESKSPTNRWPSPDDARS